MRRPERPSAVVAMAATEFYKAFHTWPTVARFEKEHWNVQNGMMSFLPMPSMRDEKSSCVHIEVKADVTGLGPEIILLSSDETESWVAVHVPRGMRVPVAYISDMPASAMLH